MFQKVLIANRGEIAARVARTVKRLGAEAIGVFSDADVDSVHCQACDEAIRIGPAPLAESYMSIAAILAAADSSGAEAIHPGYGMLAESPALARACADAGITFIGPPHQIMEQVLDRVTGRKLANDAGVRTLEGSDGVIADLDEARSLFDQLEGEIVVKAVRGGGGVGIFPVEELGELEAALRKCAERAQQLRGDGRVYIERRILSPRHVEIQLVADEQGDPLAVGDRECSIQRGTQRLLDESPAPALTGTERGERTREAIWDAAVRVAREAKLTNVGSAEFLIDEVGRAYFLELRPRLQVAHGVTEMCSNIDLVEAQLVIASGGTIPSDIQCAIPAGHAIEVRLSAEHTGRGPQIATGEVVDVRWPNASPGRMRIEASVMPGSRVTSDYDNMLAKVITHAPTRHAALLMMDRVLAESAVTPLPTNAAFLRRIVGHESFRAGQYDTGFVDRIRRN
jgi:acetyl/propionyl-CoA carboxylase alpha subunit